MHIIAVDDEPLALADLQDICESFSETESFFAFSIPALPVMKGLELAKRLNQIDADTRIVFVTGFKEYAYDAFSVNAVGYVLKPFSEDMIHRELAKVLHTIPAAPKVHIQTFGYFDVFVQSRPVYFSSSKSKELLALLVDRHGGSVSTENAISLLWPNREYDESVQSLFRKVLKSLRVSLADAGISDILIDVRNQRSVDTEKFSCDLYELLKKEPAAIESYSGEYMHGYPWAQNTKNHIDTIIEGISYADRH